MTPVRLEQREHDRTGRCVLENVNEEGEVVRKRFVSEVPKSERYVKSQWEAVVIAAIVEHWSVASKVVGLKKKRRYCRTAD